MIAWPYLLLAFFAFGFATGFLIGTRHACVPPLPPRLTDPPEPEVDARDDWWRE